MTSGFDALVMPNTWMLKAAILTVLSEIFEIRVTVPLGVSTGVIVGVGVEVGVVINVDVGVITGVDVAIPVAVEVGYNDTLFILSSMQPENSIIAAITNMHEMVLPVILFLIILRFISKSPLIYLIFSLQ